MPLLRGERTLHLHLYQEAGKRGNSQVIGVTLASQSTTTPNSRTRTTLQAVLITQGQSFPCLALLDSGADDSFIDDEMVQQMGIATMPLQRNIEARTIDGRLLSKISLRTEPLTLQISGNHFEDCSFLVIHSPHVPIVLGHTWLVRHNPQVDWVSGRILGWSTPCHSLCLKSATTKTSVQSVNTDLSVDLSSVPSEYHDIQTVFSKDYALTLPPHRPYDCSINLIPNSTYPRSKMYSISKPEREALEEYIQTALTAGHIRPSSSPLGAGFFFVGKKDGGLRPCIDFRGLNDITIKNKYPLPLMNTAFDSLQGATIFTKLDLRNAYHLIRMKEGDEWLTGFNTPLGHFEYLVMPFGLTNAPAVFQTLINDVLRDFIGNFVFVYLDDILIFSPDYATHVQHVRQVLLRLLENRLFVKAEKCMFHTNSTSFLGFVVAEGEVRMDPAKVTAVLDWPTPETRKQLQSFLGFANFYRRFIRNYGQVAAPLTALTSSARPFIWTSTAAQAFRDLKQRFTSAPVLLQPDPSRQFIVEVDASDTGIGAVLSQRSSVDGKVHPCAFLSVRLTPAERNYDVGNRELLAVKVALEEWRHWLEGAEHPFTVWTDHKNLEYVRTAKRLNPRQARLHCQEGTEQLSSDTILPELCVVGAILWKVEKEVKRALLRDPGPGNVPNHLLYVPAAVRSVVLKWAHSSKLTCHPGITRTLAFVNRRFWWSTVKEDVTSYVSACPVCALNKNSNKPSTGLLRPLPIPRRPWSHVALDFVTGLPPSDGNTTILTVVDRFTKFAYYLPLPKLPSAQETA
ncbi:hypothetical protein UPYG_G00009230, partial [Umbra pygmaea]